MHTPPPFASSARKRYLQVEYLISASRLRCQQEMSFIMVPSPGTLNKIEMVPVRGGRGAGRMRRKRESWRRRWRQGPRCAASRRHMMFIRTTSRGGSARRGMGVLSCRRWTFLLPHTPPQNSRVCFQMRANPTDVSFSYVRVKGYMILTFFAWNSDKKHNANPIACALVDNGAM